MFLSAAPVDCYVIGPLVSLELVLFSAVFIVLWPD